jgi:hypothetical protein
MRRLVQVQVQDEEEDNEQEKEEFLLIFGNKLQ